MRARRPLAACLAASCGLSPACTPRHASSPDVPAVIVVSIDTLRPDHLGCYGYRQPTSPTIDAFRREAVLVRQAVAAAPSTLASHASMFTSLLANHHGASVLAQSALRPGIVTLAQVLRSAGFATASFNGGGQLHRSWGLDRGFGVYESATDASEADIGEDTLAGQVDRARAWLEEVGEQPLFLFLHTYEVHHPYTPSAARLRRMESGYAGTLPDRISIRLLEKINSGQRLLHPGDLEHIIAAYDAEIASADAGFGDLLILLRRLGRYESSIIVLTSDHGEAFGERGNVGWHGDSLYDEQIRIPLVVKLPRERLAGRTVETQVREIDLAPSLLHLLGLPVPQTFTGTPIDFTAGASGGPRWAVAGIDGRPESVAVRTARWKWYEGRLYDLAKDPAETRDVASVHPDVETALQDRLAALLGARSSAPRNPTAPSARLQEQLRALGYVE